ncbi:NAD(P)/FAD-dependent oxidoreductase [Spirosoma aureum]|uniref:NAD(P)/FAD-dependent oxidoreductase n=1 Tax=Spirosoma aureum TaxID=2692134 RepID=A0A6G9AXM9_9BACT|nr:NAD(P)/FAD-dependent oxidoreductase [Spirosoma aureum]QIP16953.1 NAD(P)/FAD-dependent oxidoreductase [Spirosoma aureum]
MFKTDVVIIGGGLAGLVSALELAKAGHTVVLVERKSYPFHKVCGEYVSNEVKPYIQALGVDLGILGAATINHFQVSAPSGRSLYAPLDLGGFGISRYTLDHELYQLGKAAGVEFLLNQEVDNVLFNDNLFTISVSDRLSGSSQTLTSRLVIGAFGKRSKLDKTLDRSFMRQSSRSPYIGVKYHIKCDFPTDLIALHNFTDGYCGMSAIEDGKYCLCYLTTRSNLRLSGNIPDMERAILYKNPHLKTVFETADFLYDKPEVINEISFTSKQSVENHMLMVGDSAGLITPLCGNGMAMAIHGAKLASDLSTAFLSGQLNRSDLEQRYQHDWSKLFAQRLWVGRTVQQFFGNDWLTELAVRTLGAFKPALRGIMRQTHGAMI